ncbi:cell wall synthesis protein Wag31 [Actinoplanes italicus]|uniref:Cell wall synthesis protein Wag31 n=1 Tax=Actinoplanes italicus TaxID=113567 RepID=A0A2T0JZ78_9ACTN|nr:DivIVA domain-containing protein [Actinoplanes italicus]PRX14663.1 DivIVA domain-containing protein [Actinoplanes italicus]GIE34526.1 cell wall synthesis protein Wag31 [Actinoplanes italicus]
MPLTPADIHNMEFRDPLPGERGYDREQVDAFLGVAERAFTRLNGQNRALRERLQRAAPEPEAAGVAAGLAAELERTRAEQARAEQRARTLEAELTRAREEARAREGAREEQRPSEGGDRVLAVARRHADDHLREAEQKARELLDAARAKADQVTSDAELRAATIDGDARHLHATAVHGLAAEREAALVEIERLTGLLRERHARMRDLIEDRLHELGG